MFHEKTRKMSEELKYLWTKQNDSELTEIYNLIILTRFHHALQLVLLETTENARFN